MRIEMAIAIATAAVLTASAARVDAEAPAVNGDESRLRATNAMGALEARFGVDAARHRVHVDYSIRNTSAAPLMVLDGGAAVAGKVDASGAAPLAKLDGDALTLTHAAMPLPKPAPTVPRVPLAARVEPGATHAAAFDAELPAAAHRVRYCIGVAPFDEDAFTAMPGRPDVWRASFALAGTQATLCTEWFEVRGSGDH